MKRHLVKMGIIILAVFTTLSSLAQKEDKRTLISIDDDAVSVYEFLSIYQKNNVDTDLADKKSMKEYLNLYINFRLKVKEAHDMGMDTVKAFVDELAGYRAQLAEPYFNDQEVTDELLHEAYDRLMFDIRASHILIKVEENALPADTLIAYNKVIEVRERILAGENFGSLASEVSDDPSARDREAQGQAPARKGNGGDLGYFTVFDMVYPFESGAYNTPVGEISMPVRTAYGYHIILVTDKREALGKATVAHLYLALPKNATAQDSARKEQEIDDLYKRIMGGEKFEDLVKQYSDDRGSKDKGGVLPRFGSNRMVPEFIVAVSSLSDSGAISKPLLTSFGWHILKLIERKRPGDYKVEVLELKRRMTKDVRANKSKETVIKRIKSENNFREYPEALAELLGAIDSSIYVGEWGAEKVSEMKAKIILLGKNKYTQHDFAIYLDKNQKRRGTTALEAFFYGQYSQYVNDLCVDLEDNQLEEKYPEFKMLMKEYRDGILLFNLTDQKVWSKAVTDSVGLQGYYTTNKKNYMWDERLDADLVILNDAEKEKEIRQLIGRALGRKMSYTEAGIDTLEGVIIRSGIYARGENSFVDDIEWKVGQTVVHKLTDYNDLYNGRTNNENSVIFAVINDVRLPEPKTLDEARGIITSDYQNYLEEEWVKELKEKYQVVVHEEILEDIK